MSESNKKWPMDILVAGGDSDPNLAVVIGRLRERGLPVRSLLVGADTHPRATWDLDDDVLRVDGQACKPTAVFLRHDVFTSLAQKRAEPAFRASAWFTTILGWAAAHPDVRMLNRESAMWVTNKLHVLCVAREVGLPIPSTIVSNEHDLLTDLASRKPRITKPVNGGDYAREMADVLRVAPHKNGSLAAPSIVQERLVPPEVRVYGIAGRFFAFRVVADVLDYRSTPDCKVVPIPLESLDEGLLDGLGSLMKRIDLDYGAADFKADPVTGKLKFLEINNGPMFAGFDLSCEGALSNAIVDFLSAP